MSRSEDQARALADPRLTPNRAAAYIWKRGQRTWEPAGFGSNAVSCWCSYIHRASGIRIWINMPDDGTELFDYAGLQLIARAQAMPVEQVAKAILSTPLPGEEQEGGNGNDAQ